MPLKMTKTSKQMNAHKLTLVPGMLVGAGSRVIAAVAVALAAVFAAAPAAAQEIKGDVKAGEQKIDTCTGCHAIGGYRASYPTVFPVPMIHGQTSKYIESALNAYRRGDRSHPTMKAIAGSLTDQDIADLAAYYGRPLERK